jgi:protein gp37
MSKIEWCDLTWNPWHGCDKIARECDKCYAAALLSG